MAKVSTLDSEVTCENLNAVEDNPTIVQYNLTPEPPTCKTVIEQPPPTTPMTGADGLELIFWIGVAVLLTGVLIHYILRK